MMPIWTTWRCDGCGRVLRCRPVSILYRTAGFMLVLTLVISLFAFWRFVLKSELLWYWGVAGIVVGVVILIWPFDVVE